MSTSKVFNTIAFIVTILTLGCKTPTENSGNSPSQSGMSYQKSEVLTDSIYGFGIVTPRSVQFRKFGKFQTYEVYANPSTGKQIGGIERFGKFRLYTTQEFNSDTSYRELPRIEIISPNRTVEKYIFPAEDLTIFGGQIINLNNTEGKGQNMFAISSDSIRDRFSTDYEMNKRLSSSNIYLHVDFEIENDFLIVLTRFHIIDESGSWYREFETIVYDTNGIIVGRTKGIDQLNIVDLTSNGQFLYLNTGGAISPEIFLPYAFIVYDLKNKRNILLKAGTQTLKTEGFVVPHSNIGAFTIEDMSKASNSMLEAYVINHDNNSLFTIHQNPLCKPGSFILFYEDYCECINGNSKKVKLQYKSNFKREFLNN